MPIMRVLAASFPDDDSARAARSHMIQALQLDDAQVSVQALAVHSRRANAAILAGRFEEAVAGPARSVVEQYGGTLVIDIDDQGRNA